MAQSYRTVQSTFWTGKTGKQIRQAGRECQVLALYVVTSPHANMIGLYHLPLAYICADTGLCERVATAALNTLERLEFLQYDATAEWIWVCNAYHYQAGYESRPKNEGKGDHREKGALRMFEECDSASLMFAFAERYGSPFQAPSKPLSSPSGIVTVTETETVPREGASRLLAAVDEEVGLTADALGRLWNATLGDCLPNVMGLSAERKRHAKARLAEHPTLDWWAAYFRRIQASDFLCGRTPRGENHSTWRPNFDWAIKESTVAKVEGGNYDNAKPSKPTKRENHIYTCPECGEMHCGPDSGTHMDGVMYQCRHCGQTHQGPDENVCMKGRAA